MNVHVNITISCITAELLGKEDIADAQFHCAFFLQYLLGDAGVYGTHAVSNKYTFQSTAAIPATQFRIPSLAQVETVVHIQHH